MMIFLIFGFIIISLLLIVGYAMYGLLGSPGVVIYTGILIFIVIVVSDIGLPGMMAAIIVIAVAKRIKKAVKKAKRSGYIKRKPELCIYSKKRSNNYRTDPGKYIKDTYDDDYTHNYSYLPVKPVESHKSIRRKYLTNNCPNCGGLMVKGVCPYCNTEYLVISNDEN